MRTPGRPLISSNCRSSVASRDGCSGEHGIEHRPDAELLGAVALQRDFRDAALDHLDADAAVLDVLRRNDRAAQVKAGRAIEVADRLRDRGEIGLRDLLAEIGTPGGGQILVRHRRGADERKPREARTGACCRRSPPAAPRRAPARGAWPAAPGRTSRSSKCFSVCRGSKPADSPAGRAPVPRARQVTASNRRQKGNPV